MRKKKLTQMINPGSGRLQDPNCCEMTTERARALMCDPRVSVIRGNGNPLSVYSKVGYPDSILSIVQTKAGTAFPKQSRSIRSGKS